MLAVTVVAPAAVLVYVACRIMQNKARSGLPRLGKPGPIGYISTALQFIFNTDNLVQEGSKTFPGRPYVISTFAGPITVVNASAENVEFLRASNDTILSQPVYIEKMLQLDQTMNPKQMENPYHIGVVRTDVTRAVASFIPDVLEETELAIQAKFDPLEDSKPIRLPVFHTLVYLITRISNRTLVGTELCRNDGFIHAMVHFAETLIPYAVVLSWLPRWLRPATYFILSSIFGGKKEPTKFLIPYLKKCLHEREETETRPNNVSEFLIRNSNHDDLEDLAMRLINLNLGSIHTSSIFLTQALFELGMLPKSDLDGVRTEVTEALNQEGGWNKPALAKFWKIDSLLREIGRFHGLGSLGLFRTAIRDGELADGTKITSGSDVAISLKDVHFNPEFYPNPEVFDAFRFSRGRTEEDGAAKDGFTTVSNHYLPFSGGRHACPGRFFAAMEIKVILAHLLLNYDFSFPPGVTERPKNICFSGSRIPDGKSEMIFKRRPGARLPCTT